MRFLTIDKTSKESIKASLNRICEDLICNKLFVINQYSFSFIDIEVYYWNVLHKDEYANGVDHHRPLGEFELHRYGIDLSLGNNFGVDFGGILIRGLYDHQKNEVVKKPDVVKVIYNQIIQGSNHFGIVDYKTPWNEVFRSTRLNLGKADGEDKANFFDAKYKFLAKNKKLFEKYPDKETILRNSELSDEEVKNVLGYNLTR